ncbi:hypothetical protein BKA63DRAFT_560894 [Paraphoma chrysanthemicola]|nr:hypothetical protein BKA63DRAFT_560894 [Paraphoma chrysanthemicola]
MSDAQESSNARLSQELFDSTLAQIDDAAYLWTICRQVNRAFRNEVNLIFQNTWLKDTTIWWFRGYGPDGINFDMKPFRCNFSHVEGETAYFRFHTFNLRGWRMSPLGTNFDVLEELVHDHQEQRGSNDFDIENKVITRIGANLNKSYVTDLTLPQLEIQRNTNEISLNWKALFNGAFQEERLISTLQAKVGSDFPSIPYIDLTRPIVLSPRMMGMDDISSSLALRLQVRRHRIERLDSEKPSSTDIQTIAQHSLERFWVMCHFLRLSELLSMYKLEHAECRGHMVYYVEDPRVNGWTLLARRNRRRSFLEWYNNAWEDPADEGRTTWSEDLHVVETERMARAWEKGMA